MQEQMLYFVDIGRLLCCTLCLTIFSTCTLRLQQLLKWFVHTLTYTGFGFKTSWSNYYVEQCIISRSTVLCLLV